VLHWLKRHPLPIQAFFRHSLVLTYAFPRQLLEPLLPPGLVLDDYDDVGFLAVAMVETKGLRPSGLPKALGGDFFLTGYRIFARFPSANGPNLRGLRILRSDSSHPRMVRFGNLLTHYNYQQADVTLLETPDTLEIKVRSQDRQADLHVIAELNRLPAPLPEGSPFRDPRDARKFAGPLPFTFDYEKETHSIIVIEGVREKWDPHPVRVHVLKSTFFDRPPFRQASPILANAFYVANVPYRWKRGVRIALPGDGHDRD
jgi:hypothetical protein